MSNKLCFAICPFLLAEAKSVLASEPALSGMDVVPLPACTNSPKTWADLMCLFKNAGDDLEFVLLGSTCLSALGPAPDGVRVAAVQSLPRCLDLAAPSVMVDMLVAGGAHLLTPAWLMSWQQRLAEWNMDQALANVFFHEHAARLTMLDTGVHLEAKAALTVFANFVEMPFDVVKVGLFRIRHLFLEAGLVWRLQHEAKAVRDFDARLHTYAMAHDLICRLAETRSENDVAELMLELVDVLFAPRQAVYLPFLEDGSPGEPVFRSALTPVSSDHLRLLAGYALAREPEPVFDQGMVIRIGSDVPAEAVLSVMDVTFPEHLTDYHDLAVTIGKAGGMAVRNARAYERLTQTVTSLQTTMAERNRLLAFVSHEIRSPLNAMLGFANLMLEGTLEEEQRQSAEIITRRGEDLLFLINQVLNFERLGSGRIEFEQAVFLLSDVLSAARETIVLAAHEKNIELCFDIDSGVPERILGDSAALRLILVNLLNNAVKFTDNGFVALCVSLVEFGSMHAVASVENKVLLRFVIKDTGIGIPKSKQGFVFEPFAQTDSSIHRRYGGTGLGLAIVRKTLEHMGGSISLESSEGKGACFEIILPFVVAD